MINIQYLVRTCPALFLAFGLVACSSDKVKSAKAPAKPASPATSVSAWSVGEQKFIRKGEKETQALKIAEQTVPAYETTDVLQFPGIANQKGVRLKVTTKCQIGTQTIGTHEFEEEMQTEYNFFELLPLEALSRFHRTPEAPLFCYIEFLAQNSKGDTHRFSLRAASVHLKPVDHPLAILKSGAPLAPVTSAAHFEIQSSNLHLYQIGETHSRRPKSYKMECEWLSGTYENIHGPARLDMFTYSSRLDEIQSTDLLPGLQRCQLFALAQSGRVIGLSEPFVLRQKVVEPIVALIRQLPAFSQPVPIPDKVEMLEFRLTNPTTKPMNLALDPNELVNVTVVTPDLHSSLKVSGHQLRAQVEVWVKGAETHEVFNQMRIRIEAGQTARVIYAVRLGAILCPGASYILGYLLQPVRPTGASLRILENFTAAPDPMNILGETLVAASFEGYVQSTMTLHSSFIKNAMPEIQTWDKNCKYQ
jgi:hypothetical protein